MTSTMTTTPTVRSLATSIVALMLLFASAPSQAEFIASLYNALDTDTSLEWRKWESLASRGPYNAALGKYDAGSTYRLPTAAEMDNLFSKLFPGVAKNAPGVCYQISSPEQLALARAFLALFSPRASIYHAIYEDAAGQLRALYVSTAISGYSAVCLSGLQPSYEQWRTTAPLSGEVVLVMVVRDAIDLKGPVITVYNYVHPGDIGLKSADFYPFNPYENYPTDGSDTKWTSQFFGDDYTGSPIWSQYQGLYTIPGAFAAGKSAPWVRLRSIDFTPVANTGGACTAATDTLLGNGLCRRSFVDNYQPWHLTAAGAVVPGSNVYNQFLYSPVTVDNVVIEQVWDNMAVDYAPTTSANTIRPKNPGWSIYVAIKTTSIAAGDAYDFNAAYVDPASLKLGANLAPVLNYQPSDIDGDGDTDYTYQFNTGATGVTCLDTRLTLTGKTYWGVPLAGSDTVVPIGCTETVLMDVDPFNATNTIRPNDNYNVTVAILGMRTTAGDAVNLYPESTTVADGVNRSSLKFGPAETPIVGTPLVSDVDGDGYTDLLANFNVFNAGIACGDTQVQLKGNKNSTLPIAAFDNIVTTDCETGGCHP